MGRAIVRDPQVFLFDEPLSNLDAKLRVAMRTEIKELHQRLKTTSIYVTHDQIEAMTMADQIVVMRDGIVEQRGKPLELYDQPGEPLRRGLHRLAGDELPARHAARARTARRRSSWPDGVRVPAPRDAAGGDGQQRHLRRAPRAPFAGAATARGSPAHGRRWSSRPAPTRRSSRKFGDTEITAVFRERHEFRPGEPIRLAARSRIARICSTQSRASR